VIKKLLALTLCLSLSACFSSRTGIELEEKNFSSLSGWSDNAAVGGLQAFKKTCDALYSSKVQASPLFSENKYVWREKCSKAKSARNSKIFFEQNFRPHLVTYNGSVRGKFTGYFEKEIEASLKHDSVYKHPIYALPKNPNYLNFTRKQIENGALKGKGLEIAYAKSAARLFFLHIQGSGILRLPNGKRVEIGFAGKNNHPYTGVGRYMLDKGLIKHGSADDMIQWLEKNPISARTVMNMNERYVFFSLKNGGPYGSLGVELTDGASLAVDPAYIPLGVPLWLQTTLPTTRKYFGRLMNAQDTGSAIKGPIRGDIFFGEGAWASNTASGMNAEGSYFMLVPNGIDADRYF
jgi:membrane-bound lytic murein transglycosylase A